MKFHGKRQRKKNKRRNEDNFIYWCDWMIYREFLLIYFYILWARTLFFLFFSSLLSGEWLRYVNLRCDSNTKKVKRRSLPPPLYLTHITNFSLISQAHIEPINYSKFIFLQTTAREWKIIKLKLTIESEIKKYGNKINYVCIWLIIKTVKCK